MPKFNMVIIDEVYDEFKQVSQTTGISIERIIADGIGAMCIANNPVLSGQRLGLYTEDENGNIELKRRIRLSIEKTHN